MFSELLRRAVENLPMPEPSLPAGRAAQINCDDHEDETQYNEPQDTLNSALFITYRNSRGAISERRITVKEIRKNSIGNIMIGAYCYERRAFRTFRADRIEEAIDLATGEILDNETAILECFGTSADTTGVSNNPRYATKKALQKCRHAINILTYLARCDGHFHHSEEDVIVHYIMEQCFDCDFDDEYLNLRIRGLYPDTDTFFDSLDYLEEKAPETLDKLCRYAARLVQADGEIVSAELNFMSELNSYASSLAGD